MGGAGRFRDPEWSGRGKLIIGDGCRIGSFSRVVVSTTFNNLGEHIHLGHHVAIGDYSSLGWFGRVEHWRQHHHRAVLQRAPRRTRFDDPERPIRQQGAERKPVRIGENCWLGAKVTVLAR